MKKRKHPSVIHFPCIEFACMLVRGDYNLKYAGLRTVFSDSMLLSGFGTVFANDFGLHASRFTLLALIFQIADYFPQVEEVGLQNFVCLQIQKL